MLSPINKSFRIVWPLSGPFFQERARAVFFCVRGLLRSHHNHPMCVNCVALQYYADKK